MAQAREAPRSPRGFLVATNVLVSKKLCALRGLPGPLYVTPVVVLEYMNWAIASRNRMLAKRMHERAKGYERLIGLLPSLLEALGVELIDQASMPRTMMASWLMPGPRGASLHAWYHRLVSLITLPGRPSRRRLGARRCLCRPP